MSGLRLWLLAARPATLPAAIAPVLVGGGLAGHVDGFRLLPFLAALVGALLIQVGTNLANDYFDFKKGADTEARLGPVRVTQSGLLSERMVFRAMLLVFGLAVLIGLYLVLVGGLPILVIGVLSIVSGVAYTGGPYPLGYHGLGDLFVFVFFGLVAVSGTYDVQTGHFTLLVLLCAVPMGLLITAILVANNVRDIETDRLAGKYTLAVRLGRRGTRIYYRLLLIVAYLVPLLLVVTRQLAWPALLPILTVPLAVRTSRIVATREDGPSLIAALKMTGIVQLLFGVLFSIGLLV